MGDKSNSLWLPFFSLFTSLGTVVCCALPAIFVTLGAGAALAGLVSSVPQLVVLSQYKGLVFSIAGIMIVITGIYLWKTRNAPCPIDPGPAGVCMRMRRLNKIFYILSVILYTVGFFFAFIAIRFL